MRLLTKLNAALIRRAQQLLADNAKLTRELARAKRLRSGTKRLARMEKRGAVEIAALRADAQAEIDALRAQVKALEAQVAQAKAPRVWIRKAEPAPMAPKVLSPIEAATEEARVGVANGVANAALKDR